MTNVVIMPVLELVTGSGLGSLLGMRHALEPDHLAAVSTLLTDERTTDRATHRAKAAFLGMCWGLGHTLSLVAFGALVVVMRAEIPAGASDVFELAVSLMLVALGVRAIVRAARQGPSGAVHVHHHGRIVHVHRGAPAHIHIGAWTLARRPLLIGAIHGLAGSGTLTALVLATLPSTAARLSYLALFGFGSTLGMTVMTGVLGWPLAHASRHPRLVRGVSFAVGCATTVLGLAWGYPLVGRLL